MEGSDEAAAVGLAVCEERNGRDAGVCEDGFNSM